MLNDILSNIGRFVFLVLLQGIILNDLNLFEGMAIPYLYVLFILLLPIETPRWLELLLGLFCGLAIDMFTNTVGIHASACVFLAYVRPLYMKAIAPRDGYEFGQRPSIPDLGFVWFFKYAAVLILLHHTWLFFVEVYSFKGFFTTLLRILLSTIFTLSLAILSQYLVFTRRSSGYI
jgi:rod shape-determining protein MreD